MKKIVVKVPTTGTEVRNGTRKGLAYLLGFVSAVASLISEELKEISTKIDIKHKG